MVIGNPGVNNEADARDSSAYPGLKFVCLQDKATRFPELDSFPTQPCNGIMTVHHFPAYVTGLPHIPRLKGALVNRNSCWDGVNVDSPDHQSHMYDTQVGAFQNARPCPASHPVRVPQVAYETLWDTSQFNDLWENGENPFFLSYSDHHGYGTHADYVRTYPVLIFTFVPGATATNVRIRSLGGRAIRCRGPWTQTACSTPVRMGIPFSRRGCSR